MVTTWSDPKADGASTSNLDPAELIDKPKLAVKLCLMGIEQVYIGTGPEQDRAGHAVRRAAKRDGHAVSLTTEADGRVRVRVVKLEDA